MVSERICDEVLTDRLGSWSSWSEVSEIAVEKTMSASDLVEVIDSYFRDVVVGWGVKRFRHLLPPDEIEHAWNGVLMTVWRNSVFFMNLRKPSKYIFIAMKQQIIIQFRWWVARLDRAEKGKPLDAFFVDPRFSSDQDVFTNKFLDLLPELRLSLSELQREVFDVLPEAVRQWHGDLHGRSESRRGLRNGLAVAVSDATGGRVSPLQAKRMLQKIRWHALRLTMAD